MKPDQTVEVRPVRVGVSEGDETSIDDGLAPGELVVVDGADGAARRHARCSARRPRGTPRRAATRERMNLSRPFILRPVATTLLMVAILLAGVVAYRQLPVSALPQVDYPTIQVVDVLSRAPAPT